MVRPELEVAGWSGKGVVMARSVVLRSVAAIALASITALWSGPAAVAQDASPVAAEVTLKTLVETTVAAEAVPTGAQLPFELWYASLEPGVQITVPVEMFACCPGPLIEHVLAGELTLRVDGPLRVVRGAIAGTPTPEEIPPGTEVVLQAGDSAIYAQGPSREYANLGTEPVQLVSGGLFG
jgi:hypothetical protein